VLFKRLRGLHLAARVSLFLQLCHGVTNFLWLPVSQCKPRTPKHRAPWEPARISSQHFWVWHGAWRIIASPSHHVTPCHTRHLRPSPTISDRLRNRWSHGTLEALTVKESRCGGSGSEGADGLRRDIRDMWDTGSILKQHMQSSSFERRWHEVFRDQRTN
jgi:hypothetical protein